MIIAWGARYSEFESHRLDQLTQVLRPIFGLAFLVFLLFFTRIFTLTLFINEMLAELDIDRCSSSPAGSRH
jgi:hypothetical protein